jgi:hypothetical protein
MTPFDDAPTSLIAIAAAMRAAGKSWELIGEAVDRHADTVRRWPERYPIPWGQTYRSVESQLIADAASEARTTLRIMLRAKQARFRIAAATQLLKSRDANRAGECETARSAGERESLDMCKEVMSMSEIETERHLADFVRRQNDVAVEDGAGI